MVDNSGSNSSENKGASVITAPPRIVTVTHKGMSGKAEYHPRTKLWSYIVRFLYPVTHRGQAGSEAEARLEIKKLIDIAASGNNKHVRTE